MAKIYFENAIDKNFVNVYRPTPAIIGRGDWWKEMPKSIPRDLGPSIKTIRSCPAINDSINFGYILYLQTDICVNCVDDNIFWENKISPISEEIKIEYIGHHPPVQSSFYQTDNMYMNVVLKINTGFGIKTEPGYSCWITHPLHRKDLPFIALDAIVDTDKFTIYDPISVLFKKDFNGVVKAGTPLFQVIPFKRENFEMEIVDFDNNKMMQDRYQINSDYGAAYKKKFWSRKVFK